MAKAQRKAAVSASDVQARLDAFETERVAALAEYHSLQAAREAVLIDGSDEDLFDHDAAMGAAKNRAERAAVRYDRLLPDLDEAAAAEEQARRAEIYETARKKHTDAVAAVGHYDEAAARLATIARRIAAGNFAVEEANRMLPEGATPLETVEPFNGAPARPAEYYQPERVVPYRRSTGQPVVAYRQGDPDIAFRREPAGTRAMLNPAAPARLHRSFISGLAIPDRAEPGNFLF